MIVIVRLRYCPTTQAYMDRRLAEGRTKKEIIRCLKRHVWSAALDRPIPPTDSQAGCFESVGRG